MAGVSLYWRAMRPWSFTVSVIPPILGSLIAVTENPGLSFRWLPFVLTLLGCMLAHAAANALSDYFDYKTHVDREGTLGSSGVLVSKLMKPEALLRLVALLYLVAFMIAGYLIWATPGGVFLVWLILIGFILGAFYTVAPFKFKYVALGDFAVFISFGPAITLGAYFVQASHFSWVPVLYALPVAFLVDAVLHSNNLRDIQSDAAVHIKTIPILLGERAAQIIYYVLLIAAYVSIPLLIFFAGLTGLSLITVLSLPLAVRNMKMVRDKNTIGLEKFAPIDGMTAQLHSVFGLLFILAILTQTILF